MPELPEIEIVKLQLQKVLIGQTIVSIEQLHKKSLQGNNKLVIGKKITGIKRLGKMLVIKLASSHPERSEGSRLKAAKKNASLDSSASPQNDKFMCIAIHFKMSGQLILIRGKGDPFDKLRAGADRGKLKRIVGGHPTEDWTRKLPSKHTRVIFHFKSGDTMFFNDQRIFGWNKILTEEELRNLPFVKNLGPEIWDISAVEFFNLLQKKKKPIKVTLMDQEVLSGVGNIYANDALWEARIHPQIQAQSLAFPKAKLLQDALIKVLKEGIKYGGATAADAKYIDLHGLGGTYQEHFRVYDRVGQPCLKCKTKIKKMILGGRGTYFCPACQPA